MQRTLIGSLGRQGPECLTDIDGVGIERVSVSFSSRRTSETNTDPFSAWAMALVNFVAKHWRENIKPLTPSQLIEHREKVRQEIEP